MANVFSDAANKYTGTLNTKTLDKSQQQPGKLVHFDCVQDVFGFGKSLHGVIRNGKTKYKNGHGYIAVVTFFTKSDGTPLEYPITHTSSLKWLKPLKKKNANMEAFNMALMDLAIRPGKEFDYDSYYAHK